MCLTTGRVILLSFFWAAGSPLLGRGSTGLSLPSFFLLFPFWIACWASFFLPLFLFFLGLWPEGLFSPFLSSPFLSSFTLTPFLFFFFSSDTELPYLFSPSPAVVISGFFSRRLLLFETRNSLLSFFSFSTSTVQSPHLPRVVTLSLERIYFYGK